MEQFTCKTFKTSRNFAYSYYHFSPANSTNKPTLLFLHGWPDNAHLWSAVIPSLLTLDLPILIPDMLGYGVTSKPKDASLYN